MNKVLVLFLATALASPAVSARQQQPQRDVQPNAFQRQQDNTARQGINVLRQYQRGEDQASLNAMANLVKLRAKLAEAWQGMGMSPQGAKLVADAYDPNVAAQMHHTWLRGKSDQEVAQMLQSNLKDKHYLAADQMLIDYQREKLRLSASTNPDRGR
jgi:hypothetical protein